MNSGRTRQTALCGILASLGLVFLALGNAVPLSTYVSPMLAAFVLIPLLRDFPRRCAWLTWAVTAVVALVLLPDRELVLIYTLVLGPYPMLRLTLNRIPDRWLRLPAKLLILNAGVLLCYVLLLIVFPMPGLWKEFSAFGTVMTVAVLVTGNLCFVVYDAALAAVSIWYYRKLRPLLRFLH